MSKKGSCELCTKPAKMFCESDQASLCMDCDEKVHSANFLVAKHSRTLLCHACFSPTPWKADGLKLGPTVSVCHACSLTEHGQEVCHNSQESESDDGEYESDIDTDTDYSEEEEEDDDDGENQVVPWTETTAELVSSVVVCVSSSEEDEETSLKRMRDSPFEYEDEDGCCSSQNSDSKLCEVGSDQIRSFQSDENSGISSPSRLSRPLKMRRTSNNSDGPLVLTEGSGQMKGTAAIVDKLRKLQQKIATGEGDASTVTLEICELARDDA